MIEQDNFWKGFKTGIKNKGCPNCGIKPTGFPILKCINIEEDRFIIKCENCSWVGEKYQLITKEEYVNNKRIKLIDNILNENFNIL